MVGIFMGHLPFMGSISSFEVFGDTSVGFPTGVTLPGQVTSVQHIVGVALPWHGTCCLVLTIAVETLLWIWMMLLDFILQDFVVVPGDVFSNVGHSPIRDFDGVRIANFVKNVSFGEAILDDLQKRSPNICFYIK